MINLFDTVFLLCYTRRRKVGWILLIVWIVLGAIILFFSFLHLRESIKISKQNRERRRREREWANKRREQEQERAREDHERKEKFAQMQRERDEGLIRTALEHKMKLEEGKRKEEALIERFAQSEEVHKMVTHICAGDLSNRPLYIEVNSQVIFADHSAGERIRYLFFRTQSI